MIQGFLQFLFLGLTLFLVGHGIMGPQFAPKNLTTLFTWIHYRGLLVLTLLLAGNYFCSICPMMLVRNFARKIHSPKFDWPKKLQNKWPGIILFIAVLFSYEAWDLWASPFLTSLLIIFPFVLILFIDLTFRKASFCKYICPIGQFNFISSMVSPKEVQIKNKSICESCTTYECLHGNAQRSGIGKIGCELDLFLPYKVGNLDCTFCNECIHACPHENVVVDFRIPGSELWNEKHRAGIGKLSKKTDITWLILIFVMGSMLNAFGMIAPTYILQEKFGELPTLIFLFILFLGVIPKILIFFFPKNIFVSLIPLGFSIWLAHYSFHFLTGIFTFVPILQSMLGISGNFPVSLMGISVKASLPIEFGLIGLGLLASFVVSLKLKMTNKKLLLLWFLLLSGLSIFSFWIMTQPMEMRGVAAGVN